MAMPKAQKKKWKLLNEPHSVLDGNKVSAIQVVNTGENPRLAKIASRGTLVVDIGACSSVCRPGAFQTAALKSEAVGELYTVDGTPLKAWGGIRPRFRLGNQHKEEAVVTFQVVEGITDNTVSVNRALDMGASVHFEQDNCLIQCANGSKATFARNGKQFLLPFEELEQRKAWQAKIAAIDPADEEAMAVEQYALHGDEEGDAVKEHARREEEAAAEQDLALEDRSLLAELEEEAQPEGPPEAVPVAQPDSPTEHERELHRLTHLPFAPWCEFCTGRKARQDCHRRDQSSEKEGTGMVQMDCFFLATEKEEEVEDESRLVTILCLTDTTTGLSLALQLPNKSREVSQSKYVLRNIDLYFKTLGYDKIILQQDGEPAIRALGSSI